MWPSLAHRRITHLHFTGADWSRACALLDARVTDADDVLLVRVDDRRGVLVVAAADADALAQISAAKIEPWLAELDLVAPPSTTCGEVVYGHRAHTEDEPVDDTARCDRFVHEVTASGTVWGLYGETWARTDAAGEREALPLWPTREHAARCVRGPWETFAPRAIALAKFLEQWLGGMDEDGIAAVVMPTPTHPGVIVEPGVLAAALRRAAAG